MVERCEIGITCQHSGRMLEQRKRFLPGSEPEGLLGRIGERFPLGHRFGRIEVMNDSPGDPATRPFGLRYLTVSNPEKALAIDSSRMEYCCNKQIMLWDGEPFMATTHEVKYTQVDTREDYQTFPDQQPDKTQQLALLGG